MGIIGAIELSCWLIAHPSSLAASNFFELAYLKNENSSKLAMQSRTQWVISLQPDIVQIGDSSGLHGGVPKVINLYLGGLKYVNSSFGADPGYFGHFNIAKVVVDHSPSVKALVFYVTPLAKPAHYGNAGRDLEKSLYSAFLDRWSLLAPPTMAYRVAVTNFVYYGEMNGTFPHGGDSFLGDPHWKDSFMAEKGFIPRESAFHIRDPLPLGGCRFGDWFQVSPEGDRPFDYFYPGLQKMAMLARERHLRLAVVFNPVPCHEMEEPGTLMIERELARFRKDYPEVVVPFPFITTWPENLFQDSWHFFSFGGEIASNRLGKEIRKMMDDPNFRGVPPQSVEELDGRLERSRHHRPWLPSCDDSAGRDNAQAGSIYTNCVGLRFVTLPPGSFVMGSCAKQSHCPAGAIADPYALGSESQSHLVTIAQPFQMQDAPVTIAQFRTYLKNNYGDKADAHADVLGIDPRFLDANKGADDSRPISMLSWNDAKSYVAWLNSIKPSWDDGDYRLPTEAEWEYAARGGSQTAFWWGNDPGLNMANCVGCTNRFNKVASPIRSFPPNRFGLYDMNGNIWETVEDCYRDWYSAKPSDGRAFEKEDCQARSLRGGAADYPSESWSRAASRISNNPASIAALVGFRVVREVPATDRSFVPVDPFPVKGVPIASGGSPEKAFDSNPAAFWVSPERGTGVKGNAWIGIGFDTPRVLYRIEIEQPTDLMYQQSQVLVQSTQDGSHWTTVMPANIVRTKPMGVITLPEPTSPATRWRLVADSDNQVANNQAWAITKIRFFAVPASH